ncbi:hypothetical protein ACVCL0_09045 [Rhodanobacter sp. UC4450_H17]
MSVITVKSKTESFRRAGIEFSRAGVEVDSNDLTPAQALAIFSEPLLIFLEDGKKLPRPNAEQIEDLRAAVARDAAEKQAPADAAKAAEKQAAADAAKAAEKQAAADAAKAGDKQASSDKKTVAGKKAGK